MSTSPAANAEPYDGVQANQTNQAAQSQEVPYIDRDQPIVGCPVVVSYFDGAHRVHSVVAHCLAITGAGAGLSTPLGMPAITVAYPDPDADPRVISSANWQKAYVRRDSVVHFTHPDVNTGKISIAWGHAVDPSQFPHLIDEPAPIGQNPIFTRQDDPTTALPSMEQAIGVQTGKAPSPTTQSPMLNEEAQMGPAVVAGGEYGKGVGDVAPTVVTSEPKPPGNEKPSEDTPHAGAPSTADLDADAAEKAAAEATGQ